MSRPTIALACIMKNEEKNLPVLLASVHGCFDEIHITDTGSTDNSVKVAQDLGATVHYFEWCKDFAAARNASFEPVKTDFVMWLDLDDTMNNPEAFRQFRDTIMGTSDYWLAAYHYAKTPEGKPACTFVRERIVRTEMAMKWRYFVHEGIIPQSDKGQVKCNFVSTWSVQHQRTTEDLAKDKGRNLALFKDREADLDPRMQYYYGKEYFENNLPKDGLPWLLKALESNKLEVHDRVLATQYACYCAIQTNQSDLCIQLAHSGLISAPNRAELYSLMGDAYLQSNRMGDAVPAFTAAKACQFVDAESTNAPVPIFSQRELYGAYPSIQLAKVFANLGRISEAREQATFAADKFNHPDARAILSELDKIEASASPLAVKENVADIVITCPPGGFYEWDGGVYRKKGVGGSETAAVEMAEWMHKVSGRPVKIFHSRSEDVTVNGVEYLDLKHAGEYFRSKRPYAHVAWRHTIPVTDAKTYVWSHDLLTPGAEHKNYHKLMVLSDFHKNFVSVVQNIPTEKLMVTRNGIDPARFDALKFKKKPAKVVFSSSPDRGVLRALKVMDRVVKQVPEAEFHVYYGFDNFYKVGRGALADQIKLEMVERPYVHYHGNVDQKTLAKELSESSVWLYPTDFEETFCITALEMLACKVFPVVRKYGALQDTLKDAADKGWADVLDMDCKTDSEVEKWSGAVISAIREEKWKRVEANPEDFSWRKVAEEWLELFERDHS